MLDSFLIFAQGGILLFSWSELALKGSPVNSLIQDVLLEERTGKESWTYNHGAAKYTLKYSRDNQAGLVFVAVYQSILQLFYVEDLLKKVRDTFTESYKPGTFDYEFEAEFLRLRDAAEKKSIESKQAGSKPGGATKGAKETAPKAAGKANSKRNSNSNSTDDLAGSGTFDRTPSKDVLDEPDKEGSAQGVPKSPSSGGFDMAKLKSKMGKKGEKSADKKKKDPESKGKVMRVWDQAGNKARPGGEKLDYSAAAEEGEEMGDSYDPVVEKGGKSGIDQQEAEDSVSEDESSDEEETTALKKKKSSWLGQMVRGVVGSSSIDMADVQQILQALKTKLMSKNVAEEIAEKLCESVGKSLEGKRQGAMTRVSSMVREAMTEALTRILTPRRSTDILREVQMARERGRPYSIVFIGVNGVGKSTNLAKVAYWLLQHDVSVMIAACDTFRAGAVEQLRTHCRRLEQTAGVKVPLYERGYEKDPAAVAHEALRQAAKDNIDVLLVDTAGRMQDNKPLMEALAKLVDLNNPDLCLFVGEALVGNDAVDQLKKFGQWLTDLSTTNRPHGVIDGVVLTKFDTVDEKVGAALSMVYESGAPIMFVGCGQTYTDIRKLNVKQIVNCLLR